MGLELHRPAVAQHRPAVPGSYLAKQGGGRAGLEAEVLSVAAPLSRHTARQMPPLTSRVNVGLHRWPHDNRLAKAATLRRRRSSISAFALHEPFG